jgi:alpha-amylase/alpha-mannosidase (GH57 family)
LQTLKVAILWHMHQPTYWDARLQKYRYPWAFLHAARHYFTMARLAELNPEMRMAFNITPVLMDQLDHYAGEKPQDVLLEVVLRPASELSEDELRRLLDHVFKLHAPTMIDPFPRYRELRGLLSGPLDQAKIRKVKRQEVLDLQTLYLLTWCGPPLREREPVRALLKKERDYTEDDKQAVFAAAQEALRQTLPLYQALQERGQVELSTTPYYHPILPLVIDCEVARESRSDVHLEGIDFRHRSDARWQVEAAIEAYRKRFGAPPAGLWPAEGGVSDAALALFADQGLSWTATDEGILARSLNRGPGLWEKHRPYRLRDGIRIYFRDRELSDRIGFVYSGWEPVKAADDVIGRLLGIRDHLREGGGCVTIILDGENPWEYYPDCGLGFLGRLYQELPRTPGLEPVRFRDHLEEERTGRLEHVVPGSWINANFDTWIGVPEKNRAWELLASTRRKLAMDAPETEVPVEFYRAEGSDWFWWLGPGHDTPYESSYENLFRLNLQVGLTRAGVEPPAILHAAPPPLPSPVFQPPMHLFTPRLDGQLGSYYDWIAAGFYRASEGSIHRTERRLSRLRFGFDGSTLYLRIEGELDCLRGGSAGKVTVQFHRPRTLEVAFQVRDGSLQVEPEELGARGALGAVAGLAFPLASLGARAGDVVEFAVAIQEGRDLIDRLPQFGFVALQVPSADFGRENWSV